jgi:hypothetical protein
LFHAQALANNPPLPSDELTLESRNEDTRVDFELNSCLYEGRVVFKHLRVAIVNEVLLDEVTSVVESRGTYVATSSFEGVSQVLHCLVVPVIVGWDHVLHRFVES